MRPLVELIPQMLETSVEFRVDVYGDAASPYVGRRYVPPPISNQARAANLHVLAWACSKKEEGRELPFSISHTHALKHNEHPSPSLPSLFCWSGSERVPLKGGDF